MNTTTLDVQGMTCQNCVRHVREALERVPGVRSADVNLESGSAVVHHDQTIDPQTFIAAIEEEGYEAKVSA